MGHFWDSEKNYPIYSYSRPDNFPHLPAHNCGKSNICKNIDLDENNNCKNTDKTVYDNCKFYERKREGEYPQPGDLFVFGNNWEVGKKEGQLSQEYCILDERKYYYLIAEKESVPYQVIEKKNLIGKVTGTFNIYPSGYFRIVKKLEKVIFVRWVCGR